MTRLCKFIRLHREFIAANATLSLAAAFLILYVVIAESSLITTGHLPALPWRW